MSRTFVPMEVSRSQEGLLVCKDGANINLKELNNIVKTMIIYKMKVPITVPSGSKYPITKIGMQVRRMKESGNDAFTKKKYAEAKRIYSLAIEISKNRPAFDTTQDIRDELVALLCNRSACSFHLEEFPEALIDADLAIALNPDSSKACFRKGAVLRRMHRLEDALKAFKSGLFIEPKNADLLNSIKQVKVEIDKKDLALELSKNAN